MVPFFQPGPASQPYAAVRDAEDLSDVKALIEKMWGEFSPPGDPHFLREAKWRFHDRTWELYVWYVLWTHGFDPQKTGKLGPDFFFHRGGRTIWLEAVAPGKGEGPDAVPSIRTINEMIEAGEEPVAETVPEEKILLRFTEVIQRKQMSLLGYQSRGIVKSEDSYVLAINGCHATDFRGDPAIPFAIKATLALGHLMVSLDPKSLKPTSSHYQRRSEVMKLSQQPVSTALFLTEKYSHISAILYSPKDICNVPERIGSEMYYFHNPFARNPIPQGMLRFCTEYWADLERGELHSRDWPTEVEP